MLPSSIKISCAILKIARHPTLIEYIWKIARKYIFVLVVHQQQFSICLEIALRKQLKQPFYMSEDAVRQKGPRRPCFMLKEGQGKCEGVLGGWLLPYYGRNTFVRLTGHLVAIVAFEQTFFLSQFSQFSGFWGSSRFGQSDRFFFVLLVTDVPETCFYFCTHRVVSFCWCTYDLIEGNTLGYYRI